jgi:RimJ/RimL family protein N-acetyltransferase
MRVERLELRRYFLRNPWSGYVLHVPSIHRGCHEVSASTVSAQARYFYPVRVFLETDRLVLRRFIESDVDDLVELDADPDVMRFVSGGPPTRREEFENDLMPRYLWYYEQFAGYGFWAAIERSTGDFIGWFHFRPAESSPSDEPELGYRLRKSFWGKGYASEGARALICKGFAELGVRRVVADTMVVNAASRHVLEKCGLTVVRIFFPPWPVPIEGDEHGHVEYALSREEWERLP